MLLLAIAAPASFARSNPTGGAPPFKPIDPQKPSWQPDLTWDDYHPVPGTSWEDPTREPTVKKWKVALVLADFDDLPFVISQPAHSTIFGNPQASANNVPRDDVPEFYRDLLNTPNVLNNFTTMHKYWMEDTFGKYGVQLDAFGPYRLPALHYQYFVQDFGQGTGCPTPAVTPCNRNIRTDTRAAWLADVGQDVVSSYDNIFYVSAGQDETGTWQEFGEMRWATQELVPEEFGPPDPTLPNWMRTRYVPWTSWASGSNIWPNAGGNTSIEGEASGMAVYAHELTHNLGIGDNYNNPFNTIPQRSATGVWDMMSRGSFNGPGGTHTRYLIPSTQGSALGSNHNLRNRLKLGFVGDASVLRLNRNAFAESGLVVGTITPRAVDPGATGLSGFQITLDGPAPVDHNTSCSPATAGPLCSGNANFNGYTLEAVQQLGNDSFTPGHGVLISKTKTSESSSCGTFTCFVWIIDANPQDIDKVDFVRPDGSIAKVTIGDPRQLNDATFTAGLGSGSQYEWEDTANRLHFYVVDVARDADGVLRYTVAVRSLDGAGPQTRGVALADGKMHRVVAPWAANCVLPLTNTGTDAPPAGTHPEDVSAYTGADVYRVTASIAGNEWNAQLYNALVTARFGETVDVPVYVTREWGSDRTAVVTVTATSESDPTKSATAECRIKISNMNDK